MLPRFPFPLADFWVFLQNTYSTVLRKYFRKYNLLYRVVHVHVYMYLRTKVQPLYVYVYEKGFFCIFLINLVLSYEGS